MYWGYILLQYLWPVHAANDSKAMRSISNCNDNYTIFYPKAQCKK